MNQRTKLKIKNTAEQVGGIAGLLAIDAVALAVSPIVFGIRTAKQKKGEKFTMQMLGDALVSYGKGVVNSQKFIGNQMSALVQSGKDKLEAYDEEMAEAAREMERKKQAKIRAQAEAAREMEEAKQAEIRAQADKEKLEKMKIQDATPARMEETGAAAVIRIAQNSPEILRGPKYNSWIFGGLEYTPRSGAVRMLDQSDDIAIIPESQRETVTNAIVAAAKQRRYDANQSKIDILRQMADAENGK